MSHRNNTEIVLPNLLKLAVQAALASLAFSSIAAHAETSTSKETLTLPEVNVSAKKVQVEEGYQVKRTSTATKTDTPLIDIPQSITIMPQELMKDQAVQNLGDVIRYTPGVGTAQGEGNRETFIFRGQTTTGDFFIDGVRDDTQYYRDLYNIERVEVLKGANGMIFGRGGAGGVINRVSKEAGWNPIRELTVQFGSYDQKRTTIDVNQPINDVASFRINAMVEDSGSYRDGVELQRHGINPTLTLLPTDRTKVVLSAEYFKDDRIADRGIPSLRIGPAGTLAAPQLNRRPFDTNESTFFGDAKNSPTGTEVQSYSALLEHAFENGITLRNRTRYAEYDKFYQNVFANGSVDAATGNLNLAAYNQDTQRQNFFNQTDVLYTAMTGSIKHELLAGLEVGRQHTSNLRLDGFFNNAGTFATSESVSGFNPRSVLPVTFTYFNPTTGAPINRAFNTSTADIMAVYFQDQIKLTEKWQAVLGLRYDRFEMDFHNKRPTTPANDVYIKTGDDLFSPRAGLIYKPVEQVSLYTSYTQTYVPRGGDQLGSLAPANSNFDPEKFINKEIGAKWDVTPALSLTAAVYKLDRLKQAITNPNDPTTQILLDGTETKGFELGVTGQITSKWSVFGGYANQKAEVSETQFTAANNVPNANDILSGTTVGQVPRETLSLWNRYNINETWGAALGLISRSDMYAVTPTAANSVVLPGYTRFDGAIYAKLDKNLRLQLNVENLFNKEYYLYAHTNDNITPGSPTAARLTLIANF